MKAPTEKRNDIIQIIVTRSCDLFNCSNCTQLLPFRSDTLHMGLDCFRDAVRSVREWPGIVALFGGNPCSHPRFPDLCAILVEEIPDQRHRGIWSNAFLGHGQVIRDTFYPLGRFNLNAHADTAAAADMEFWCPGKVIKKSIYEPASHTPILMDWRDLGITEDEWVSARERCDINLNWSSAIAERGGRPYAYFCEVGASLDGVRGENNGIPATPGWWEEPMARFIHQVDACCDRGCGVPLRRIGHLDRDDTYDLTASWAHIQHRGKIKIEVHETMPSACHEGTDYMGLRKP